MTSPIADMLTRLRNALMIGKPEVVLPSSKLKVELSRILKENNYIVNYNIVDDAVAKNRKNLKIILKYEDKKPAIKNLKMISKPGRRIYARQDKLPVVLNNFGIAVISTSQGLMTNNEAKKRKLGGEVICEIY